MIVSICLQLLALFKSSPSPTLQRLHENSEADPRWNGIDCKMGALRAQVANYQVLLPKLQAQPAFKKNSLELDSQCVCTCSSY